MPPDGAWKLRWGPPPARTTPGARVEARREAGHRERAQLVGVQDQARRRASADERLQCPDQQLDLLDSGLAVFGHQSLGRLQHRRSRGVGRVVRTEIARERVERLDLGDDVEAASLGQLQIDVHERFEPPAEPRRRLAHALGDRPHQAPLSGEQGDDAVGLTKFVRAQDNARVAVEAHRPIVPSAPRPAESSSLPSRGWPPTRPPAATP